MYNHKSISTSQIETIKKNQIKVLETEVSYLKWKINRFGLLTDQRKHQKRSVKLKTW